MNTNKSTRTGRFTRKTAASQNPKLASAYKLLRSTRTPFYNDKLPAGGRSLKPLIGVSYRVEQKLERLANVTVRTGSGMPRFHFHVGREVK